MKNYKLELITHDYVNGKYQRVEPLMALTTDAVSYTHLTLPTKRIV